MDSFYGFFLWIFFLAYAFDDCIKLKYVISFMLNNFIFDQEMFVSPSIFDIWQKMTSKPQKGVLRSCMRVVLSTHVRRLHWYIHTEIPVRHARNVILFLFAGTTSKL